MSHLAALQCRTHSRCHVAGVADCQRHGERCRVMCRQGPAAGGRGCRRQRHQLRLAAADALQPAAPSTLLTTIVLPSTVCAFYSNVQSAMCLRWGALQQHEQCVCQTAVLHYISPV